MQIKPDALNYFSESHFLYGPSRDKLNVDQGLWTYQHATGLLTFLNYDNKSENRHHSSILKPDGIVQGLLVICPLYPSTLVLSQWLVTSTYAIPMLDLAGLVLFKISIA